MNNRTLFHSGGSKPNCAAPLFNQRDSARDGEGNLYVKIGDAIYRCDEITQAYASAPNLGALSELQLARAALDAGITNPELVADLPAGAQIAADAPTPGEILATRNAWNQQGTCIDPDLGSGHRC